MRHSDRGPDSHGNCMNVILKSDEAASILKGREELNIIRCIKLDKYRFRHKVGQYEQRKEGVLGLSPVTEDTPSRMTHSVLPER